MKFVYLIILAPILSFNSFAQQTSQLVFNDQLNHFVTKKTNVSPTIFEVNSEKYTEIVNASTKSYTPEYKEILELINLAKIDSISAVWNKKSLGYKLEALEDISMSINNFLESKEEYYSKKEALQYAQKVSRKHNFGYLIYADGYTNPHYASKFVSLSNSKKEMKNYLKDILERIEKDKSALNNGSHKLEELRAQLKKTKKYKVVSNANANVKNYDMYTLGNLILNPEGEITGNFETLGRYYVLNTDDKGYKANQLVSAIDVRSKKIKKENFLFNSSAVLIRHTKTKKTYLVKAGFVNQYAVNKGYTQL